MSKQKSAKFTAKPDKTRPEKPLVELTEAQLESIADGLMKLTILYTSFKEELMSKQKREKLTNTGL